MLPGKQSQSRFLLIGGVVAAVGALGALGWLMHKLGWLMHNHGGQRPGQGSIAAVAPPAIPSPQTGPNQRPLSPEELFKQRYGVWQQGGPSGGGSEAPAAIGKPSADKHAFTLTFRAISLNRVVQDPVANQ